MIDVALLISRVGQNRVYTPYMTVYLATSQLKNTICIPYIWSCL
jgi:hypothetical protein